MKAAIVTFPGSNRDQDMVDALTRAAGRPPAVIWHRETELPAELDLIVLPGGFSYGDYLRTGAIAARSPVMRAVVAAAERGTPVLGVCNGFQILTEAGLLPGVLMRNAHLKFACRFIHMRVETSDSVFTRGYDAGAVMRVPIAHADGNYFVDAGTLAAIEDNGQVAFRYCTPEGEPRGDASPNGSVAAIAGVFNARRNVLGLMPHPENATDPALGATDGKAMFDGLVEALS